MTTMKRQFRIALTTVLVFAMAWTGMYILSPQILSPAPGVAVVAYADTPTESAITPASISTAQVEPIKDITYDGKKKKPSPKVMLGDKQLKKDRDYTVTYKNNKLPGKATMIIKSKAPNYTGEIKMGFNIIVQTPKGFKLTTTTDSVQASWKKTSGKVTGYTVVRAANAKFTKAKIMKTITSAKTRSYSIDRPYYKSVYYVKVRAYVKIGGKKYYSSYTDAKVKSTKVASWFKKISNDIDKKTKWIEADLSKQIVYLHEGKTIVKRYAVSSGRPGTPTLRGTFRVYKKIKLHDMRGDWDPVKQEWGYVTPNVKWATYFKEGYAFHGSYWNPEVNKPIDEKRTPRSHGCVNMREKDAKYLYRWAPIGTFVVVHK